MKAKRREPSHRLASLLDKLRWVTTTSPMASSEERVRRREMLAAILILAAGVVGLFWNLGEARTLGSHEVLSVAPAREMWQSGDWLVPTYGGLPRLRKPPLYYWILAGTGSIFGTIDELSARIPAAVSALLLAVLVGMWGNKWYGRTAGLGAFAAQLTSAWVLMYGRKTEADMFLCLLMTAAMYLVASQPDEESRGRSFTRWSLIYGLLSLGWLLKFHFAPAMVLAPVILWQLIGPNKRHVLRNINPLGWLLALAAVVVWPLLVIQRLPNALEVWRMETVGRVEGDLGDEPFWFFLPQVLWMTLPWAPFAIAAMKNSLRSAFYQRDRREQFLWCWFLGQLLIVSIQSGKHRHYINPALPVFSLLAGQSMIALAARLRSGRPLMTRQWAMAYSLAVVAICGVFAAMHSKWIPEPGMLLILLGLVMACSGIILFWMLERKRILVSVGALSAFFAASQIALNESLQPRFDRWGPTRDFCRDVRAEFPDGETIHVYGLEHNPPVCYLESSAKSVEELDVIQASLSASAAPLVVMTNEKKLRELQAVTHCRVTRRQPDEIGPRRSRIPRLIVAVVSQKAPGSADSPEGTASASKNSPRMAGLRERQ